MGFVLALIVAVLAAGWLKQQGVKRSKDDVFAGICGGVAKHFGWDTTVVRFVTFLLAVAYGFTLWAYIVAWIVLDEE